MKKIIFYVITVFLETFLLTGFSYAVSVECKEKIIPEAEMKIRAKEDILACAFFISQTQKQTAFPVGDLLSDGCSSKVSLLSKIAVGYANAGQYDRAIEVTETAAFKNFMDYKNEALIGISVSLAKAGEFKKALELLSRAQQIAQGLYQYGYPLNPISKVAIAYMELKEYDRAIQLAETINKPETRSATFIAIAGKLIENGEKKKALKLLEQALKLTKNGYTLAEIAVVFSDAKDRKRAIHVLKQASQTLNEDIKNQHPLFFTFQKANALVKLGEAHIRIGEKSKAEELLNEAMITAKSIQDRRNKFATFVEIAAIYLKAGDKEKATEILSEATQEANNLSDDQKGCILSNMAENCAKSGLYEQAILLLKQVENSYPRLKTIENEFKTATAREYHNDTPIYNDPDLNIYYNINCCYKVAKYNISLHFLESQKYKEAFQSLDVLGMAGFPVNNAEILSGMAFYYAKTGERNKSLPLLYEALELVNTLKPDYLTIAETLVYIADIYNKAGIGVDEKTKSILYQITSEPANIK